MHVLPDDVVAACMPFCSVLIVMRQLLRLQGTPRGTHASISTASSPMEVLNICTLSPGILPTSNPTILFSHCLRLSVPQASTSLKAQNTSYLPPLNIYQFLLCFSGLWATPAVFRGLCLWESLLLVLGESYGIPGLNLGCKASPLLPLYPTCFSPHLLAFLKFNSNWTCDLNDPRSSETEAPQNLHRKTTVLTVKTLCHLASWYEFLLLLT